MRSRSQRKGAREEDFLLELLREAIPSLSLTSNSGARFNDGDFGSSKWMVEAKSTKRESFSLKRSLVRGVEEKGWTLGKTPLLAILTNSEKPDEENVSVVLPWSVAKVVLRHYHETAMKESHGSPDEDEER